MQARARRATAIVPPLFFLSGATALLYQIVWTRLLALSLGSTTYATAVVLAVFMAGLGIGGEIGGRIASRLHRPLLVYGILEGVIGLLCGVLPFTGIDGIALTAARWGGDSPVMALILRVASVSAILLPPTLMMGATLPILARSRIKVLERAGRTVSTLYCSNTAGACAGALATGFFLLPELGLRGACVTGALLNFGIFALAVWLSREETVEVAPEVSALVAPTPRDRPRIAGAVVLLTVALGGAAAMIDEVAWTRVIALCLGSSVHALSLMLATFIFGLALGSGLVRWLVDRTQDPYRLLAAVQACAAILSVTTILRLGHLPDQILRLVVVHGPVHGRLLLGEALAVAALLLPPTVALGMAFPVAVRACSRSVSHVPRVIGRVVLVGTLGSIVGSLVAGFALLPLVGAHGALVVAALLNGTAAVGPFFLTRRVGRRLVLAPVVILGLALPLLCPSWDQRVMTSGPFLYATDYAGGKSKEIPPLADLVRDVDLLYLDEGPGGTVTVFGQPDGSHALAVNGKVDATDSGDMPTQVMLGHLPLLLHPREAESLLVVGLGSGATLAAALRHASLRKALCVEILPGVIEAARRHFGKVNDDVLRRDGDRRAQVIEADARLYLTQSRESFDVITSEPSNPWLAGMGSLFSREFFGICKERLVPDGVLCQWIHANRMSGEDLKVFLRTFVSVFDHVLMFETISGGDFLLLGCRVPLLTDPIVLEKRLTASGVKEDLESIGFGTCEEILASFVADRQGLVELCGKGPIHTDDNSWLEFSAPRNLHRKESATDLAQVLLTLDGASTGLLPGVAGSDLSARVRVLLDARREMRRGVILERAGDVQEAAQAFEHAYALNPTKKLLGRIVDERFRRAFVLMDAGAAPDEVLAPLLEASALASEDPRPEVMLARISQALGRADAARRHAREARRRGATEDELHAAVGIRQ